MNIFRIFLLKAKLKANNRKALVFGLYRGELQFLENIIQKCYDDVNSPVIIAHESKETYQEFSIVFPQLLHKVSHVKLSDLRKNILTENEISLYISSDGLGLDNIYSIYAFHGQPSKGLTFTHRKLDNFDDLFLYGKLQKDAYDHYIKTQLKNRQPTHLSLHKIGYTKSDDLIRGTIDRNKELEKLGLPVSKTTVLYAPAFNEHASLRQFGLQILKILCKNTNYNVLTSLPVDCLKPKDDAYANGGIDWYQEISKLENKFSNFRLFRGLNNNSILAASDVLITCVSSISFEFLAIKKPVIFINTPLFFSSFLKQYLPEIDTAGWENLPFVNGGKLYGITINQPKELVRTITKAMHDTIPSSDQKKLVDYLLYNPGHATVEAVKQIKQLIKSHARTSRHRVIFSFKKSIVSLISIKIVALLMIARRIFNIVANRYGYTLEKTGLNYLRADITIGQAQSHNLSICDYLESLNIDKRKIGRRDRIIAKLNDLKLFNKARNICEIGTGTGMYLEKVIQLSPVARYEIYETSTDWNQYLHQAFKHKIRELIIHNADGYSLFQTTSGSIDVVHVHGVFVYLPIIRTFDYLLECVRVCKKGGFIVFDVISDDHFDVIVAKQWSELQHKFPVITPKSFISDFIEKNNLRLIKTFEEIYGGSSSKYYVLQK